MEKQKLRMIHNMARSGSTLICKCLGCMEGVVLLSELHPLAWEMFDPVKQAQEWFGLLTDSDVAELKKQKDAGYAQAIMLIERRCREQGKTLVLRDWAHLDYTGVPYISNPPYRPMLYTELAGSFDIIRISTARDPVTQGNSLIQLEVMQEPMKSGKFGLNTFLAGYRRYAELCAETGFIRYEDFLQDPQSEMRKMCDRLQIRYDPGFIDKWSSYNTITGDVPAADNPDDAKMPHHSNRILPLSSRPVGPALRKRFLANADYRRACELLGYALVEE